MLYMTNAPAFSVMRELQSGEATTMEKAALTPKATTTQKITVT
jgi:hypothetical protein